jgi:hypothetical protein
MASEATHPLRPLKDDLGLVKVICGRELHVSLGEGGGAPRGGGVQSHHVEPPLTQTKYSVFACQHLTEVWLHPTSVGSWKALACSAADTHSWLLLPLLCLESRPEP